MSVKERIKQFIEYKNLSIRGFSEIIGVSSGYITSMRKSIQPDKLESIALHFPELNIQWLLTGDGVMLNTEQKSTDEATLIENPNIIMAPLVSQYAYAGYLSGFADPEYMETLPKVPMFVDHESKGKYVVFEVRGDSMEEDSRDGIFEGDRLYCRLIKKDLWGYKLHIKQWDFVIVHETDGILIKRITVHNVESGDITIHSLNPQYPDKVLNLREVSQLFNVVEITRGKRR